MNVKLHRRFSSFPNASVHKVICLEIIGSAGYPGVAAAVKPVLLNTIQPAQPVLLNPQPVLLPAAKPAPVVKTALDVVPYFEAAPVTTTPNPITVLNSLTKPQPTKLTSLLQAIPKSVSSFFG